MVSGTIDGVPMIFYGQENGISQNFGFSHYEENFGKEIPHFKEFNSLVLRSCVNQTYAIASSFTRCSRRWDRRGSSARRCVRRTASYLNQTGNGGVQQNIFSVAKYQTADASPGVSDVVFAFVNLDRNDDTQAGNYNVNINDSLDGARTICSASTAGVITTSKTSRPISASDTTRRNTFLFQPAAAASPATTC